MVEVFKYLKTEFQYKGEGGSFSSFLRLHASLIARLRVKNLILTLPRLHVLKFRRTSMSSDM